MLFLFLEMGTRPVAIYLLARCVVNVLSIHADVTDDADDVDDVDDVGDVGDADDADLAKTLLPTFISFDDLFEVIRDASIKNLSITQNTT
jgi:hypothetical protein